MKSPFGNRSLSSKINFKIPRTQNLLLKIIFLKKKLNSIIIDGENRIDVSHGRVTTSTN